MVRDAKALAHGVGNAWTGPQVGGTAARLGPLEQRTHELAPGPRIQFRGTAWRGVGPQRNASVPPVGRMPPPHAPAGDPHAAGYLHRRQARLQQVDGMQPTSFQSLWATRGSHRNTSGPRASDIYCTGINNDDLLTVVLGRLRNRVVANLGIYAFGPQQELLALKRYALPLHPKTIVWVFFEGNDLSDLQLYEYMTARWSMESQQASSLWHRAFTKNAILAIHRLLSDCNAALRHVSYGTVIDQEGKSVRMYFCYPGLPLSPQDIRALDQLRFVLTEAYELCRRQGIDLIVAFAPTKYRVYRGIVNPERSSEDLKW